MNNSDWKINVQKTINSRVEEASSLIQEMLEHLRQQNWKEEDLFGVHLALEEAIMNAIKHGNQNDATKLVELEFKATEAVLYIRVTDQGVGFDPSEVPDPTDDENLEVPSGRGIMLMRHFMTTVDYENSGTTVVLEKKLAS